MGVVVIGPWPFEVATPAARVSVKLGVRLAGAAPVGGGQVLVVRDQLLFIGSLIFAVNTKVSLIIVGVVFDPFD